MLTEYEETVIKEIAHHIVQPNLVQRALAQAGKPVAFILDQARSLKYFDMVSKKIIGKIPVGKSPHGIYFHSHAARK